MRIQIAGLGIIMYSPTSARHIRTGEDYLATHYMDGASVQAHVRSGSIVGFCTGTPGDFDLELVKSAPDDKVVVESEFKLRLGLEVKDGLVCFRDLCDLMNWDPTCPEHQTRPLANGTYRLTVCSSTPTSGVLGDNQRIIVYLEAWPTLPDLADVGVPMLCG